MANEGTDMTDLTQKEQCKRGCMRWGAGIGLVLALLFWLVFGWGFIASLFLGIILGLVTFVVLSKLMCGALGEESMQTASTPAAAAAPATAATTQAASAAPTSDAEVEPEPTLEAEPAATETVETRPEDTTGGFLGDQAHGQAEGPRGTRCAQRQLQIRSPRSRACKGQGGSGSCARNRSGGGTCRLYPGTNAG